MSLVCAHCARVNPADAAYCYHDGASLAGRVGARINPGSAPFPTPFVFPDGRACRNFDQFAMTCQLNWAAALDLLKQGSLPSFFGQLGRADLVVAAQEAARFPDPDRGLDQLLGKLPTQVLEAAKLRAEPSEINLGQVAIGNERTFDLHLTNLGMRLLYGAIASEAKWLTMGEAPGQSQKVFQFGTEAIVQVQVRGQYLRAGMRPLEGQLVLDSNGGSVTVTVRADIPITPFAGGFFHGAVTPRQVAEKAKANPNEAAPYFEDGRIAAWFQRNGWTYPVQGPPMSGIGAVQQFFEALGVAKPPKIEVRPSSIGFEGEPNTVFEANLEVATAERKVVYAWATANRPWITVGKTELSGRKATIPITITVPDRDGTQEGMVTVVGNGQSRFTIPITLTVIGGALVLDTELIDPRQHSVQPGPPPFPVMSVDPQAAAPADAFAPTIGRARPVVAPSAAPAVAGGYVSGIPVSPPPMPTSRPRTNADDDTRSPPQHRDNDDPVSPRGSRYDEDEDDNIAGTQSDHHFDLRRLPRRQPAGMSIASMVLGLIGLGVSLVSAAAGTIVSIGCCCGMVGGYAGLGIGGILAIVAIALGLMGMNQGGKAFAYTGIATGAVTIVLIVTFVLLTLIFGVAFFAVIANQPPPPRRF